MADLRLGSGVLGELIAAFNGFGDLLYRACADIRTGDAAVTGDDPLAGDVHGFADSWNLWSRAARPARPRLLREAEQDQRGVQPAGKTADQ